MRAAPLTCCAIRSDGPQQQRAGANPDPHGQYLSLRPARPRSARLVLPRQQAGAAPTHRVRAAQRHPAGRGQAAPARGRQARGRTGARTPAPRGARRQGPCHRHRRPEPFLGRGQAHRSAQAADDQEAQNRRGQATQAGQKSVGPAAAARIAAVGARAIIMTAQLNGNQEGALRRGKPNLSCPRNGKWTKPSPRAASASVLAPLVPRALGRTQRSPPQARIPANR